MSLFGELGRRNVIRAGAAYLALTWLIVQITGAIVPALNLPAELVPMVVWIGVIGFPCVLVFSWVYELTPEGLKRESAVAREQSITRQTGRRLDLITVALVMAAMVFVLLDRFVFPQVAPAAPAPAGATVDSNPQPVEANASAPGTLASQPATAPDEHSIAVLPFVNMSEDRANEFFSDGIAEELLNLLAQVPQLKVIARTSSFAFKGKQADITEIAQRLNVAHVLEGSVRKAGNKVRITAQLIRTADSTHLWSGNYDRSLDDVFAVQDEIASAVVKELKIKLLGAAPSARPVDARVYPLILEAQALGDQGSAEGDARAMELYRQALAIAPEEARAWSGLGRIHVNRANAGVQVAENTPLAREALQRAVALDPYDALTQTRLGGLLAQLDNDLPAAALHYQHALTLDPGTVGVVVNVANFLQQLGRLEPAIGLLEHARELDPANPLAHSNVGYAYHRAGRRAEGIAALRRALSLSPGKSFNHFMIGSALLLDGEAAKALAEIQAEPDPPSRLAGIAMAQHALGRAAESEAALQQVIAQHPADQAFSIAMVYAWRRQPERAFAWLDRAVDNHESVGWAIVEPLLEPLHEDPRWTAFLRRIGRAPEQLAAIDFDVRPPQQPGAGGP